MPKKKRVRLPGEMRQIKKNVQKSVYFYLALSKVTEVFVLVIYH